MDFGCTLVIMAAGMGSRFGGLKQLEPIGPNGEALLDFSVYDAKKAGFTKVVFVIKRAIEKQFKELVGARIEKMIDVEYVYQETTALPNGFVCPKNREKPWGTGQAVLCCEAVVSTPFAVINADDYYGASAYRQIYSQLRSGDGNYCMVGYRLSNTVTENGYVSRGICHIVGEMLKDVTEYTKIDANGVSEQYGERVVLPPDTVVSMNMWGFTTDFFDYLNEYFTEFLKDNLESEKAEFYLPFVVDSLIKSGEKAVKILVAEDKWYGVTYMEDKGTVVDAISKLVAQGNYA